MLQKAKSLGIESILQASPQQEKELAKANEYYASKGFEYFQVVKAVTGHRDLPDLSDLHELAGMLVKDLKKVCMDATDGPV